MYIPVDLPRSSELAIMDWEEPTRENGRDYEVDKCVSEERPENFVNVEGQRRQMEVVGEGLGSFLEPDRVGEGEGIDHYSGGGR